MVPSSSQIVKPQTTGNSIRRWDRISRGDEARCLGSVYSKNKWSWWQESRTPLTIIIKQLRLMLWKFVWQNPLFWSVDEHCVVVALQNQSVSNWYKGRYWNGYHSQNSKHIPTYIICINNFTRGRADICSLC